MKAKHHSTQNTQPTHTHTHIHFDTHTNIHRYIHTPATIPDGCRDTRRELRVKPASERKANLCGCNSHTPAQVPTGGADTHEWQRGGRP